eukprot:3624775-Amphidinium_carterae.1
MPQTKSRIERSGSRAGQYQGPNGICAVRRTGKGDKGQFKPRADEVMLFLSIEEPRLTNVLKRLQTICAPITDLDVIAGSHLKQETERFASLSKVILHRLLSMTEGEGHALAQSLIHTRMWIRNMEIMFKNLQQR